jgi:hypothetical protein
MRLTLAVPHLLTMPTGALAGIPALARLARYAAQPHCNPDGIDAALVAAVAAGPSPALAPLAAAGAGFDTGGNFVLRADPVAFVAGRDDVLLSGRVDDLSPSDAAAMTAVLDRHFADDGLRFHVPRPDAWFVVVAGNERPQTTPLPAVRGAIHPHEPRGEHARTWRRWLSEMQMLLHAHPANAARESRGQALVTGIWISEGGVAAHDAAARPLRVFATPGRAGDVARGLALATTHASALPPERFADLAPGDDAVVVLPPIAEEALSALVAGWLDPAVAALEHGALGAFTLVGDSAAGAWTWRAPRPSLATRLAARWSSRAFVPPPPAPDTRTH